MHRSISLDGTTIGSAEMPVFSFSSALLNGKGIFTTIAVRGGSPILWEKHWRRLTANAGKVGIDLSEHSERKVERALNELVVENMVVDGRARITFFDERPSPIWPSESEPLRKTGLSIVTGGLRPISDNFKLTISPYQVNSRSPLAGVKSCNYLENILTLDEAKRLGFDEAVRVNENGHVTSAAMANLFWLKDGGLYTPSLATGCLPGTTREYILENLDCREVEAAIDELQTAEAIFLTSAGLGVAEAAELDGRKLRPVDHPIKKILSWAN